ncbi:MAG: hypothetical protein EHM72_13915, partial [Calditrichaeota bacterium]
MAYLDSFKNIITWNFLLFTFLVSNLASQSFEPRMYDLGNPILSDIWVDRQNGDDRHTGNSR